MSRPCAWDKRTQSVTKCVWIHNSRRCTISIQIPPFQGRAIQFSNSTPMRASACTGLAANRRQAAAMLVWPSTSTARWWYCVTPPSRGGYCYSTPESGLHQTLYCVLHVTAESVHASCLRCCGAVASPSGRGGLPPCSTPPLALSQTLL
jgi:hypothetical protein